MFKTLTVLNLMKFCSSLFILHFQHFTEPHWKSESSYNENCRTQYDINGIHFLI